MQDQIPSWAAMILPAILAITVHEAAHGWVASRLGDQTALRLGRVTFNPLRHIDPVGTLLVPALTYAFGGLLFGWAKPVPVDWRNLRHPRRDMALVAAAGPAANLLMAFAWSLLIQAGVATFHLNRWLGIALIESGVFGVIVNLWLMALNLLPILPLDGGRILHAALPGRLAAAFARLEPVGLIILLVLLATGLLGGLLHPLVDALIGLMPSAKLVQDLVFG